MFAVHKKGFESLLFGFVLKKSFMRTRLPKNTQKYQERPKYIFSSSINV